MYHIYPDTGIAPEWFFWPAYQADRLLLRPHMWADITERRPATVRHAESNQRAALDAVGGLSLLSGHHLRRASEPGRSAA